MDPLYKMQKMRIFLKKYCDIFFAKKSISLMHWFFVPKIWGNFRDY